MKMVDTDEDPEHRVHQWCGTDHPQAQGENCVKDTEIMEKDNPSTHMKENQYKTTLSLKLVWIWQTSSLNFSDLESDVFIIFHVRNVPS